MKAVDKEKRTVEFMIRYYCSKIHHEKQLCNECSELIAYTAMKLDKCRYGNDKMSCKKCTTHCYGKEQRESIRKIMRYVGPRMIFLQPLELLRHSRLIK